MNISDFTHIFLPNLVKEYCDGELPLHGLIDVELWKQIFPDTANPRELGHFFWYQIRLNSFGLQDQTLLLTFTLPTPLSKGQPKFAGIRLDRNTREAHYYLLTKPQSVEDQWDIFWLPLPKGSQKMKLEFCRKIDGTDSLRNFVLTAQHIAFADNEYNSSLFSSLLRHIKDTVATQD